MKTLYLHIGTPKTATSYIQKFCSMNREVFLKYDYLYPKSVYKYPEINNNRNAHFLVGNLNKDSKQTSINNDYITEGFQHLHSCFETCNNVILSDESLWFSILYRNPNPIELLLQDSFENNYVIKIVVYFRRQDQFLISRWNQQVKNRDYSKSFAEFSNDTMTKRRSLLDYLYGLQIISNYIDKSNIIVRRYDEHYFFDGTIQSDFLHSIGLKLTKEFVLPDNDINLRLKGNTIEIKRIANTYPGITLENRTQIIHILQAFSELSENDYSTDLMSTEEINLLLNQFSINNQTLVDTYIKDNNPLFSMELSQKQPWDKNNKYMHDDIIRFTIGIFINLSKKNDELNTELTQMKVRLSALEKEAIHMKKNYLKLSNNISILLQMRDKLKHPCKTICIKLYNVIKNIHSKK